MTTTLIPTDDQTQLLLESPMTDAEKARKIQIEACNQAAGLDEFEAKLIKARGLFEIYQSALFRGSIGGTKWTDYIANRDEMAKLDFEPMDKEPAANLLAWSCLCDAIKEFNAKSPARAMPLPKSHWYMQGWATLFDRSHGEGGGWAPFALEEPAKVALKTWYTACCKLPNGKAPNKTESCKAGREARDQGYGRKPLAGSGDISQLAIGRQAISDGQGPSTPEPVYEQRTTSAADRQKAAADRAAREQRQAEAAAYDKSLRDDGIDPRLISTMEKESDFDAMNECETYSVQLGKLHQDLQTLEVWVRGRLNQYGSVGMDHLRSLDAGLYTISGDIKTLCGYRDRLDSLIELLGDDIEPGDLSPNFNQEPTN